MANNLDESLVVGSSDTPELVLTPMLMNARNFFTWRHWMEMMLKVKMKFGFVDGTIPKPAVTDANFAKWESVNALVLSWILNSLTEEIKIGFLYADIDDARALWLELDECYGQCKNQLIYQIQLELRSIRQGTQSVAAYFNKLYALWNELAFLRRPLPVCADGAQCAALIAFKKNSDCELLMKFLSGLNESFEDMRNHILGMNPLPTVYRAVHIMEFIEKERDARNVFAESSDHNTAGQRHSRNQFRGGNKVSGFKN